MALVTGEIVFDSEAAFSDAVVRVMLEDVSLAGAPATVIAEQVIRNVDSRGGRIPFSLEGTLPADNDDRARYSVRAHVSLHGGEDFKKGDFISTQSYPVLTHGHPKRVTVHVKRI
jgi:uncharacterized lipoprotein YbaY